MKRKGDKNYHHVFRTDKDTQSEMGMSYAGDVADYVHDDRAHPAYIVISRPVKLKTRQARVKTNIRYEMLLAVILLEYDELQ